MSQNSKYQVRLPIVLCLGLAAGVFVGATLNTGTGTSEVNKDVQKLREILTQIKEEYVDTVNTTALVDDAIQQILHKLDPHSSYIPVSDRIAANEDLRGNFDGIGIEFNIFDDTIVVLTPLSGGPSEALGVQAGDKIITVDGKNVAGIGINNAGVMRALKRPRGTEGDITALRRES